MKTIFFDIDGTLLLSGRAGLHAIQDAMLELFGIEQLKRVRVHGCTDRGIAGELFAAHGIENSDENWQRFRDTYIRNLERELPRRPGNILPGVAALLTELHAADDLQLGLLTGNVAAGAKLKLTHYELAHYFGFGGFGDDHPERNDVAVLAKQNAEQFCGREIDPDQMWVIGDTENDIRCARWIGAKVIAVATGDRTVDELREHEPDLAVETLEMAEILDQLLS